MAIIENRVTEEGDVLIIKPEIPIVGLIGLNQFVTNTLGETETDYFKKEFRYSNDGGLVFSDWYDLNLSNISSVSITKYDQFVIEYKYTRVGNAPEVELEFEDILVSGEFEDLPYPIYNSTYFKDFFNVNDINVFGWALNVLEKLYLTGILPKYIIRGEIEGNILQDEDFITFWNSITHYYAILVYLARQFKDITNNTLLIELFIHNRGLEIGESTIDEVLFLFNNWVFEFEKRGTYRIIETKIEDGNIQGEFLRLIGYKDPEEMIFAHLKPSELGWCVGVSSPMYQGTEKIINLIKGYEFTEGVFDLSKYPLLNSSEISLSDDKMLINSLVATDSAGIFDDGVESKRIIVNPLLSYEISFFVEVSSVNTPLTFSLKGYDVSGNNVNFENLTDGSTSNNFIVRQNIQITNKVFWVRGMLKGYNEDLLPDSYLFPNGNHLRSKSNLKYIVPQIYLDNTLSGVSSGVMKLSNIKVRPLYLPFTKGQLGMKNIILAFINKENSQYDQTKLEEIIQSSMINAGSFFKAKYIQ